MIPENYSIIFASESLACKYGYIVDTHARVAYKGPRFTPTEIQHCLSFKEFETLQIIKACMKAMRDAFIATVRSEDGDVRINVYSVQKDAQARAAAWYDDLVARGLKEE